MSRRERRTRDRPTARSTARDVRSTDRPDPFPVDVTDRGDAFLVSAELPGLRTRTLDVAVGGDRPRIDADFGDDEGSYLRRERDRGIASRTIALPEPIDEEHVSASDDAGVPRVTRRKRRRPRRVEVR